MIFHVVNMGQRLKYQYLSLNYIYKKKSLYSEIEEYDKNQTVKTKRKRKKTARKTAIPLDQFNRSYQF